MLSSGWYSMQDFHKSWQSYTPVNRGTICVKVHPFRLLPIKGNNCSLIPYVFILFLVRYWVAEWSSFGKELLTRLTMCSLCILTICNFSYFPFSFRGLDLGSGCFRSWSLGTFFTFMHLFQLRV